MQPPSTLSRAARCAVVITLCSAATRLPAQQRAAMPDSVRDYISTAMAAFRAHSVHRAEVDWGSLEDSVVARATSAQTPASTWTALAWALRHIDEHSFLMPPERVILSPAAMTPPSAPPSANLPVGRRLGGDLAVIIVSPHSGKNRPAYVDSLHSAIRVLDSAGVCGWILDLRQNTGGNMWPMLAGVGPLLGAEAVGSFTNSVAGSAWRYRDGRSWNGGAAMPAEPDGWGSGQPPRVAVADVPVALLLGRRTLSSGEMLALAFLGRPNVRSFGDSTGGRSSSNASVPLRDGVTLFVTSAYPKDRLGRSYALRIAPDEPVPSDDDASADTPMRRASDWLHAQAACAARR